MLLFSTEYYSLKYQIKMASEIQINPNHDQNYIKCPEVLRE